MVILKSGKKKKKIFSKKNQNLKFSLNKEDEMKDIIISKLILFQWPS